MLGLARIVTGSKTRNLRMLLVTKPKGKTETLKRWRNKSCEKRLRTPPTVCICEGGAELSCGLCIIISFYGAMG